MAESREASEEPDARALHLPRFGQRLSVPPAPVGVLVLGPSEHRVGILPGRWLEPSLPPSLRLRTHDPVATIALEFLAAAGIEEGVIRPAAGLEHDRKAAGRIGPDIGTGLCHAATRPTPCEDACY